MLPLFAREFSPGDKDMHPAIIHSSQSMKTHNIADVQHQSWCFNWMLLVEWHQKVGTCEAAHDFVLIKPWCPNSAMMSQLSRGVPTQPWCPQLCACLRGLWSPPLQCCLHHPKLMCGCSPVHLDQAVSYFKVISKTSVRTEDRHPYKWQASQHEFALLFFSSMCINLIMQQTFILSMTPLHSQLTQVFLQFL